MNQLIEFVVVPLKLPELADLPLQLPDQDVLLLALPLGGDVGLVGGLRVFQVFAEHYEFNDF